MGNWLGVLITYYPLPEALKACMSRIWYYSFNFQTFKVLSK